MTVDARALGGNVAVGCFREMLGNVELVEHDLAFGIPQVPLFLYKEEEETPLKESTT